MSTPQLFIWPNRQMCTCHRFISRLAKLCGCQIMCFLHYLSFWQLRFQFTLVIPPCLVNQNVIESGPVHAKFCTVYFVCTLTNNVPMGSSTPTPNPAPETVCPFAATLSPSGTQSCARYTLLLFPIYVSFPIISYA